VWVAVLVVYTAASHVVGDGDGDGGGSAAGGARLELWDGPTATTLRGSSAAAADPHRCLLPIAWNVHDVWRWAVEASSAAVPPCGGCDTGPPGTRSCVSSFSASVSADDAGAAAQAACKLPLISCCEQFEGPAEGAGTAATRLLRFVERVQNVVARGAATVRVVRGCRSVRLDVADGTSLGRERCCAVLDRVELLQLQPWLDVDIVVSGHTVNVAARGGDGGGGAAAEAALESCLASNTELLAGV
jgi:hypothetical protein